MIGALMLAIITAGLVPIGRATAPGKDWTRPYNVQRHARTVHLHTAALELAEGEELDAYVRRREAGQQLRGQLLALWRRPMKDRRPSVVEAQRFAEAVARAASRQAADAYMAQLLRQWRTLRPDVAVRYQPDPAAARQP